MCVRVRRKRLAKGWFDGGALYGHAIKQQQPIATLSIYATKRTIATHEKHHRMTRKGIRLIFLNQDGEIIGQLRLTVRLVGIGGNANKRVDAVGRMGKSCLFFLSLLSFQRVPGIDSLEDRRRSKRKIIRF